MEENMKKYNYGMPVDMGQIDFEEKYAAFKDFAEGSELLEECLITADKLGLETTSCCRGYHKIENPSEFMIDYLFNNDLDIISLSRCMCPAYIAFNRESDIISYLSSELINDPNVEIIADNQYSLHFYGAETERLLTLFIRDMKSGKKSHGKELINKVNQHLDPEVYYNSFVYGFTNSGLAEEDIEALNFIMVLNACRFSNNCEDIHEFCSKKGIATSEEEIILNELNIQKNTGYNNGSR